MLEETINLLLYRWDEKFMMRIAVFSNMYPTKEHPTFGIFVKNQVELLRTAHVDVDVIAIDNPRKGKVTTIKKYASWFVRSFIYLLKNRKQLTLTHAHYAFPTGLLSLMGKKLFGIPYVVTVHGGDIDKMAVKSARIAKLTTSILTQANQVIVVGEKLRQDVTTRFGVSENHVKVMSMGVDTTIFKQLSKVETREMLRLKQDKNMILFVGNVIRAKGVFELVQAFQIVKKTNPASCLYIIGAQRDQSFIDEIQQFIHEKEVHDVYFKAPVNQRNLALWMAATDVFALPSHHEGFGLVALEAMAAGARVVGSDVGGLSYLLGEGAGILTQSQNPASLAEGLMDALDANMDANEKIVQERVTTNSFQTILENILTIYREVEKK